jgi:hypothetical protein
MRSFTILVCSGSRLDKRHRIANSECRLSNRYAAKVGKLIYRGFNGFHAALPAAFNNLQGRGINPPAAGFFAGTCRAPIR